MSLKKNTRLIKVLNSAEKNGQFKFIQYLDKKYNNAFKLTEWTDALITRAKSGDTSTGQTTKVLLDIIQKLSHASNFNQGEINKAFLKFVGNRQTKAITILIEKATNLAKINAVKARLKKNDGEMALLILKETTLQPADKTALKALVSKGIDNLTEINKLLI